MEITNKPALDGLLATMQLSAEDRDALRSALPLLTRTFGEDAVRNLFDSRSDLSPEDKAFSSKLTIFLISAFTKDELGLLLESISPGIRDNLPSKVIPTVQYVEAAVKLIIKMGLKDSLKEACKRVRPKRIADIEETFR